MSQARVLFISLLAAFVAVYGFFLWEYFAVDGSRTFTFDFLEATPYTGVITPAGNVQDLLENKDTDEQFVRVRKTPVFFSLTPRRAYDTLKVHLDYTNTRERTLELGILNGSDDLEESLRQTVDIPVVRSMYKKDWRVTPAPSGYYTYGKDRAYDTVAELAVALRAGIPAATYGIDVEHLYIDDSYVPTDGGMSSDYVLRGGHTFLLYASNEDMTFEFDVTDVNRADGTDAVRIEVENRGEIVYTETVQDDEIGFEANIRTDARPVRISIPGADGVYEIRVEATTDIMLHNIRSDQERVVVNDMLYLADSGAVGNENVGERTVWFDGASLSVQSNSVTAPEQTAYVNGKTITIPAEKDKYIWEEDEYTNARHELRIPDSGIIMRSYGFFALTAESYFDVNMNTRKMVEDVEIDDIVAAITTPYSTPTQVGRTRRRAVLKYDLTELVGDRKNLDFVLTEGTFRKHSNLMTIYDMKFEFEREPLHTRLLNRLR